MIHKMTEGTLSHAANPSHLGAGSFEKPYGAINGYGLRLLFKRFESITGLRSVLGLRGI